MVEPNTNQPSALLNNYPLMSSSANSSSKSPELSIPHFHSGGDFEYEKFYQSAKGLAASIVKPGSADLTTIFRNTDIEGINYFQYRFSKSVKQQASKRIIAAINFLESYRIYVGREQEDRSRMLNEPAFSIIRMYHGFSDLTVWEEPLSKSSLADYFGEIEDREVDPSVLKDPTDPDSYNRETVKEFIHAESLMIGLILEELDEDSSYFLPVPLIARGRLMGAVYLVFDESKLQQETFKNEIAQQLFFRAYCLGLTREYERIALERRLISFAARPSDPLEGFEQVFNDLNIQYFFSSEAERKKEKERFRVRGLNLAIISGNLFLKDMGYKDFYEFYGDVYIQESKTVETRKRETLKGAITSIIVDSFAHNVGAHSLVALKWWFEERFKKYDKSLKLNEIESLIQYVKLPSEKLKEAGSRVQFHVDMSGSESASDDQFVSFLDVVRFGEDTLLEFLFSFYREADWDKVRNVPKSNTNPVTRFPLPTDFALYQYFEFLRNKSAFWSGVSRDLAFSGRIRSLRFLLQRFVNNSLFLGTVAHSEGINKVNIHLEFLQDDENPNKPQEEIVCSGEYAVVDLSIIRSKTNTKSTETRETNKGKKYSEYAFLREGEDYKTLKEQLEKFNETPLFFPGGIIGEQAFFTLLENTLRNIKHYRSRLEDIRKSGINLFLSFKKVGFIERNVGITSDEKKLIRIGTWLHHQQDLYIAGSENNMESVIQKQTDQLKLRIIEKSGGVRLGGSSQDKVCASFLMNGSFDSIDAIYPYEAKKHYFPYVYSSSEEFISKEKRAAGTKPKETILHITYDQGMRDSNSLKRKAKYQEAIQKYHSAYPPQTKPIGSIKKYFYTWIGEDFKIVTNQYHPANELLARNKIVAINEFVKREGAAPLDFDLAKKELRKAGLVRIIEVDKALSDWEKEIFETDNASRKAEIKGQQFQYAMAQWLGEWLQKRDPKSEDSSGNGAPKMISLLLKVDKNNMAMILLKKLQNQPWIVEYHGPTSIDDGRLPENIHTVRLQHGQNVDTVKEGEVRIRSHGALFTEIYRNQLESSDPRRAADISDIGNAKPEFVESEELLETILTRIVMFDNRAYERLPGSDQYAIMKKKKFNRGDFQNYIDTESVLKDKLLVEAFPEKGRFFDPEILRHVLLNTHFLVIHLSYLETIWKKIDIPGETFREDQVVEFFEERIKRFYQQQFGQPLPSNFMLVITSGRGRSDWIDRLKEESEENEKNYFDQITFRPIESIVGAIEDGRVINDDFQIKYNLCKMLYGS